MVDLAAHILDTKASKCDLHKFKDKYEAEAKSCWQDDRSAEKAEESNVIDLMDALKQGLGRKKAGASRSKRKKSAGAHRGGKRKAA